ncbi:MAG: ABC transporter ATP-binding protein [Pseudolabrys sp.]
MRKLDRGWMLETNAVSGTVSTRRQAVKKQLHSNEVLGTGSDSSAVTTPGTVMLKVDHVFKSFKTRDFSSASTKSKSMMVLNDISLDVSHGEFVSLLGASGCGKTTLLRMMAGLLHPDRGTISVGNEPVKAPRKDLCMVFQNFGLLPWRSVMANTVFPLEIDGVGKSQREDMAAEYLKLVGLGGFERHFPHELSGGMQQRVGIARALIRKPLVLLMDEPFAALDAQTREKIQDDFLGIWGKLKTTIVFVTHAIDESLVLSDRVVVLSSRPGRVNRIISSAVANHRGNEDVRARPEFGEQAHEIRELLRSERTA